MVNLTLGGQPWPNNIFGTGQKTSLRIFHFFHLFFPWISGIPKKSNRALSMGVRKPRPWLNSIRDLLCDSGLVAHYFWASTSLAKK